MCGFYRPNSSPVLCGHQRGVLQFNSIDTNCLELVQAPQVKGSVPRDGLALGVPIASSASPGYPRFCLSGFPMILSSESIICSHGSQTSGKLYLLMLVYCQGDYKGHKWTVRQRALWGETLKGPKSCSFCPYGVQVPPSQHLHALPSLAGLQTPLWFFWGFHYLHTVH